MAEMIFNKEQKIYMVQVDEYMHWTPSKYRPVTAEKLDEILDKYGRAILNIVSNGEKGAMAMWACFKDRISGGSYSDMINAYRLLTDDSKNLVEREHELRHLWDKYEELWCIRFFGTVEAYHLEKAQIAKEHFERYCKAKEDTP